MRDVDESEPFVLGGPPERARAPVVQHDVDAVVHYVISERVRNRLGLVPSVVFGRDPMIERERIPREASARQKRRRSPFEYLTAIRPRRQMEKRAVRAVDQRGAFVEREI